MNKGTVKFFDVSKGYGFITNEETGKDIFVHVTNIKSTQMRDGDRVTFNEIDSTKGKVASEVKVV